MLESCAQNMENMTAFHGAQALELDKRLASAFHDRIRATAHLALALLSRLAQGERSILRRPIPRIALSLILNTPPPTKCTLRSLSNAGMRKCERGTIVW